MGVAMIVALSTMVVAVHGFHITHQVITLRECNSLITVAEREGFNLNPDSIDGGAAQDIYIYQHGVMHAELWGIISPLLPRLEAVVANSQVGEETCEEEALPTLDWIFLRKYGPTTERNWLMPHTDRNQFSVNLALNDDFSGGGMFIVRKITDGEPDFKWILIDETGIVPHVKALPRVNSSEVLFPAQRAGTVIAHNFTTWHGVAPVEEGTKYSLLLFFGMPSLESDHTEALQMLDDALVRQNELQECIRQDKCSWETFGREMADVVRMLRPAAAAGDATALFLLAQAYFNGVGVDKDTRVAIQYFKRVLRFSPEVLKGAGLDQAAVLGQLGEALHRQGKKRKAHEATLRARQLEIAKAHASTTPLAPLDSH